MVELDKQKDRKRAWAAAASVADPEIPVLDIEDLGILRDVRIEDGKAIADLTPTYSGCPAVLAIEMEVEVALRKAGFEPVINRVFTPPWTTDWITPKGRAALENYGIAAPLNAEADKAVLLEGKRLVSCPQCSSTNTRMVSQFGSTACKAQFQCDDCLEPFDYFKCLK